MGADGVAADIEVAGVTDGSGRELEEEDAEGEEEEEDEEEEDGYEDDPKLAVLKISAEVGWSPLVRGVDLSPVNRPLRNDIL